MILMDLSMVISAAIYMGEAKECAMHPSQDSKNMIKHSVFNSIRANYVMHKQAYGTMVLACDNGSWRYDAFTQYKHQRKLNRIADTTGINWEFVNEVKSEMIAELDKYFPFITVKCPNTEGDDIIGVLCKHIHTNSIINAEEDIFGNTDPENILIISSDGDNYQLQQLGKNIRQYSSNEKRFIKLPEISRNCLIRKIVKGDTGDGVPNIKSVDNTLVDKVRQKPISEKYLQTFFDSKNPIDACLTEDEKTNYLRNEKLVSYEKIPDNIQQNIISCYNESLVRKKSKMELLNYFAKNRMSNLYSQITDFFI
jgi:hypothetical protein